MAHRLLHCKCRVEGVVKLIKCMGSELTHAGVDWMRKKSVYVSDIARLAKFWSQTVLYIGCGNGKSFFLELVAVSAAMEVEGTRKDHSQAFKRFLSYMVRMDQTRIVFIGQCFLIVTLQTHTQKSLQLWRCLVDKLRMVCPTSGPLQPSQHLA